MSHSEKVQDLLVLTIENLVKYPGMVLYGGKDASYADYCQYLLGFDDGLAEEFNLLGRDFKEFVSPRLNTWENGGTHVLRAIHDEHHGESTARLLELLLEFVHLKFAKSST